jgi:hypothetical protein
VTPKKRAGSQSARLLYLDWNYLRGIAKRKPAFRGLERARDALGAVRAIGLSGAHAGRRRRMRPVDAGSGLHGLEVASP